MNHYSDIFFDLDRTLWDFDKNSAETLGELFDLYNLSEILKTNKENFIQTFSTFNTQAWREFKKGGQTKDEMRSFRFVQTFQVHGSGDWKMARKMSTDYLANSPKKPHLIDGVTELLEELSKDYRLHLITNGFSDTQRIKITSSGLDKYLDQIIISEETSYVKPQKGIFKLAMYKARTIAVKSLMVGDDWSKDIEGAKTAGMDQAFYNPTAAGYKGKKPTVELRKMNELLPFLKNRSQKDASTDLPP